MTTHGPPIDNARAVEIARAAIRGHVELGTPSDVRVERTGNRFVVTFPHRAGPGSRTADYEARVTIDAGDGSVLQLLGGS